MNALSFRVGYAMSSNQSHAIAENLTAILGSSRVGFSPVVEGNTTTFVTSGRCHVSGLKLAKLNSFLDGARLMLLMGDIERTP